MGCNFHGQLFRIYSFSIHSANIFQMLQNSLRSIAKFVPTYLCPPIKHMKTHFMVLLLNMSSLCNFLLKTVVLYCQETDYGI